MNLSDNNNIINEQIDNNCDINSNAVVEKPLHDSSPKGFLHTVSNVLSAIFSPLLVPTYAYAIVMWTTMFSVVPEHDRLISALIVFFITAIVPFAVILFMIRKGLVSDPAISDRKERLIPYLVTILCYFFVAWCLGNLPYWVPTFFVGAGIAAMLDALINLKWKISAHATAMGGLCALELFIGMVGVATVLVIPWVSTIFILSGAVCSARLYLKRHTPAQVYAGWSLGFVVTFAALILYPILVHIINH